MTREEAIQALGEWLEQMIQHGVPSHSEKRKALATAIALLSAETHEIRTETHGVCSDLISRTDAINAVGEAIADGRQWYGALLMVPSARPTGEWSKTSMNGVWKCSECNAYWGSDHDEYEVLKDFAYCPNCGAQMVQGGDDE